MFSIQNGDLMIWRWHFLIRLERDPIYGQKGVCLINHPTKLGVSYRPCFGKDAMLGEIIQKGSRVRGCLLKALIGTDRIRTELENFVLLQSHKLGAEQLLSMHLHKFDHLT